MVLADLKVPLDMMVTYAELCLWHCFYDHGIPQFPVCDFSQVKSQVHLQRRKQMLPTHKINKQTKNNTLYEQHFENRGICVQ